MCEDEGSFETWAGCQLKHPGILGSPGSPGSGTSGTSGTSSSVVEEPAGQRKADRPQQRRGLELCGVRSGRLASKRLGLRRGDGQLGG